MKKLVIIASVALAAFISNAAQFRWQFTTTTAGDAGYNGSDVYMILAADYDSSKTLSLADITSAAKSKGTLTVGSMSGTTGPITVNDSWVTEGTDYSWYAIVVSGDKYYVSDTATVSTAVSDTGTPTTGSFASKAALQTASNWHTMAVPEPTSALLMLFGMAGLALKRKRA